MARAVDRAVAEAEVCTDHGRGEDFIVAGPAAD
jgi:hypothetical protein